MSLHRTIFMLAVVLLFSSRRDFAQPLGNSEAAHTMYDAAVEKGLNHRWITVEEVSGDTNGPTVNRFAELEMGMHYISDTGVLTESDPKIESFPEGAVARSTALKVIFSPNINVEGAIDVLTPKGTRLKATPLGLAYLDPATGLAVTIAETKDSAAKIVPPNRVVYEDFLDGVNADAIYEITKTGITQFILIKENLPPPSAYGLPDATARLEVMTEFPEAPRPTKIPRVLNANRGESPKPDFIDETLKFGDAVIPHGVAFSTAADDAKPNETHPVGKKWEERPSEGRSVLYEAVEYQVFREALQKLTDPSETKALEQGEPRAGADKRNIPSRRVAANKKERIQVASSSYAPKGILLDWSLIVEQQAWIPSYTFNSGETYVIQGTVKINNVILHPGCFIKYRPGASLHVNVSIQTQGTASNPSILTGYDDNAYGVPIPAHGTTAASACNISSIYADKALYLEGFSSSGSTALQHLRIRYANVGIYIISDQHTYNIQHTSFEYCGTGVYSYYYPVVNLSSVSLCNVGKFWERSTTDSPFTEQNIAYYTEVPKSGIVPSASSFFPYSHPWAQGVDWDPWKAIDGSSCNPIWHSGPEIYPAVDQWVMFDLRGTHSVGKVKYWPRLPSPYNGRFNAFEVYVTQNALSWGSPVAQGTFGWQYGNVIQDVEFTPVSGRYVILKCISGYGDWAAVGEVNIYERTAASGLNPPMLASTFNTDHSAATIGNVRSFDLETTVRYTINGSDPTFTSTTVPPTISSPTTVKARAFKGTAVSPVASLSIDQSSSVVITPNGHSPVTYSMAPLAVQLAAQPGATINYKVGTTGSYVGTSHNRTIMLNGIDSGVGSIEAYSFTPSQLRSAVTTSEKFAFRLPPPASSVSYNGTFMQGTLTFNTSVSGATIRYTDDRSSVQAASPIYSIPLVYSAERKVYARVYKQGYVPSVQTSSWVNKLLPPGVFGTSGPLPSELEANNAVDVWLLPNLGFDNVYAELKNTTSWNGPLAYSTDAPNSNFPGSFSATVSGPGQTSAKRIGVSYGRTYSLAGWFRGLNSTTVAYAGLINFDTSGATILSEDVNSANREITYLTQDLVHGATTAFLQNEQLFASASGAANLFVPLINYSIELPIQTANQPLNLKDIYQPTLSSGLSVTAVNASTHSVTLSSAYSGPTLTAGTPIARRSVAGTYQYLLLSAQTLPTAWTSYQSTFNSLRAGTEEVGLLLLMSYTSGNSAFSGYELWEGGSADKPKLYFRKDGNNNVFSQPGVNGPIKLTLNGNHEGSVRIAQRGTYYIDSPIVQKDVHFIVAQPIIQKDFLSSYNEMRLSASSATIGAEIHYTVDGTEPTAASALYTAPLSTTVAARYKFKAFKANYTSSKTIGVQVSKLPPPEFSRLSGTFNEELNLGVSAPQGAQLKVWTSARNFIDPSSWKVGSALNQIGFSINGLALENKVENRLTPFGTRENMWVAFNTDAALNSDGGWNGGDVYIDKAKTYRFTVWMKKTGGNSGYSYLGCRPSTVGSLTGNANESPNVNPYFWSGSLPLNEWHLVVGYVRPAGYTGTTSASCVYNSKGEVVAQGTDFKWLSNTYVSGHRSYLWSCADPVVEQMFWDPRVEVVNSVSDPIDILFQPKVASPIQLPVVENTRIYAMSYNGIDLSSDVVSENYLFKPEPPIFSHASGTYNAAFNLAISAPPGAALRVWKFGTSLINPGTWQSGTVGSQPGFTMIGTAGENSVELRTTPYGTLDEVWVAKNSDTTSGATYDPDGGWNGASFAIDKNQTYRFSVWLKKTGAVSGFSYLGCGGASTVSTLTGTATDSTDANPYFWFGSLPLDEWHLIVGYIHPAGYLGTVPNGRVFNSRGEIVGVCKDFRWLPSAATTYHRSYLFYSTDLTVQQEFWNPRVEVVSGPPTDPEKFSPPINSPASVAVSGTAPHEVHAVSSKANWLPSDIVSGTFIVNPNSPIISVGTSGRVNYYPGWSPLLIAASSTVTSSASLAQGTLTVAILNGAEENDRLQIRNSGTGAGQIGISGANVSFGGATIGTFSGGAGVPLVIQFNANVTVPAVQELVRSIQFHNISAEPDVGIRAVEIRLLNTALNLSHSVKREVDVKCAENLDVVVVLDVTSSMQNNNRFQKARDGINLFLDKLRSNDRAALVTFCCSPIDTAHLNVEHGPGSSIRNALQNATLCPPTGGSTRVAAGILGAIDEITLYGTQTAAPVMVVLTDGADTCPGLDSVQAAENAKDKGIRVITIAVDVTDATAISRLQQMASSAASDFYAVSSAQEVSAAYINIAASLCLAPTDFTLNAGPDRSVFVDQSLSFTALLNGVVTADAPDREVRWSAVSGPGEVRFSSAESLFTRAGFSVVGEYIIRVEVEESGIAKSDTVNVHVEAERLALEVDAGPDRSLKYVSPATVKDLEPLVSNADASYTAVWAQIAGPQNANALFTTRGIAGKPELVTASFPASGVYRLMLTVQSKAETLTDTVTINVCDAETRPLDIAIVIDCSTSMLDNHAFAFAKEGAARLIERLKREAVGHQITIVPSTGWETCGILPLTSDWDAALDYLEGLSVAPFGTYLNAGLAQARTELLSYRRNPDSVPLIVLLSDFVIPIGFWSAANCIEWYPDWTDPHPVAAEIKTQKIRIATISTMQRKDPGHVFLEMRDSFHECTIQHTYADCINVMNALASRPDWVFEIDSEAQISDRLGLLLDNICAGGTVADIPAAGPSPTLASANCDEFFIPEDSRDRYLDVLRNDRLVPLRNYAIQIVDTSNLKNGSIDLVTVGGRQTIRYTPVMNYCWSLDGVLDVFQYKLIENGSIIGDAVNVTIIVSPENDPPVAEEDYFEVPSSASQLYLFVLQNDSDIDISSVPNAAVTDSLRITSVAQINPSAGVLKISPQQDYLIFNGAAQPGEGLFHLTYTIEDRFGGSAMGRLTLKVTSNPQNQPVAKADTFNVLESTTRDLNVLRNDTAQTSMDPNVTGEEIPALSISSVSMNNVQPANLPVSFTVSPDAKRIIFSSTSAGTGVATATYQIVGPGGLISSAVITVNIVAEVNDPPIAINDDEASIEGENADFPAFTIFPTANDYDPEGFELVISGTSPSQNGATITVMSDPQRIVYNPGPYRGSDTFTYTIKDPSGNTATAQVMVHTQGSADYPPTASLAKFERTATPEDAQEYTETPASLPAGAPDTYDHLRDKIRIIRTGSFDVEGTANDVDATDHFEYFLTLSRFVPDPEDSLRKTSLEVQRIVSHTKVATPASLGVFDLTTLPNGVYQVQLMVQGGAQRRFVEKRFILDSNLKLGDLNFTVEDLNIPVSGIELSVRRNYSSMAAAAGKIGDFGPGWTYSGMDLDVEFDEVRAPMEELVQFSPSPEWFSKRFNPDSGLLSGRNITLNIPDGPRATFYFSPKVDSENQKIIPRWKALPGIGAIVQLLDEEGNDYIGLPTMKWAANGHVGLDGYDIPAFKLKLADGTEYTMLRENLGWHEYTDESNPTPSDIGVQAWGTPFVSEVKVPTGEKVVFTSEGVHSYANSTAEVPRKSLRIVRREGRIHEIYDPLDPVSTPALMYRYDSLGNLTEVHQRVRRTNGSAAEYLVTKYYYEDKSRPHLITSITDPREKLQIVSSFDEKGRLKTKKDSRQAITEYDYDSGPTPGENVLPSGTVKGRIVTRIYKEAPGKGYSQLDLASDVKGYDEKGNIVYSRDSAGVKRTFEHNSKGTMTASSLWFTPEGGGEEQAHVTTYTPDYHEEASTGFTTLKRLVITGPTEGQNVADHAITVHFNPAGAPLRILDATGGERVNHYDAQGRLKEVYNRADITGAPAGPAITKFEYSDGVEIERSLIRNPVGQESPQYTSVTYTSGDLIDSSVFTLSDGIGPSISSEADENLRLGSLTVGSRVSSFSHDDLGRETRASHDISSQMPVSVSFGYEGELDWSTVEGATIGSMEREYDDFGRLEKWNSARGEVSFTYDLLGRVETESDEDGIAKTYVYTQDGNEVFTRGDVKKTVTRNSQGLVASEISTRGGIKHFEYYPDGRLKAQSVNLGSSEYAEINSNETWKFEYPITKDTAGNALGSQTVVTDPLKRKSISKFSKDGMLESVSDNSCCGETTFTYLLNDPLVDGQDYPLTIRDAGNRVRTYSYVLDNADVAGTIGQLKTATDLRGKVYSYQYYKPTSTSEQSSLKKVVAPAVNLVGTGNTAETLVEFTYDDFEREKTIKYAGLGNRVKEILYEVPENVAGAQHKPSAIKQPNGSVVEFRYDTETGRLKETYLKSSPYKDDLQADRVTEYSYKGYDQPSAVTWREPANPSVRMANRYLYGRVTTVDVSNDMVLIQQTTLKDGDPVRFSSTGTLPGGLLEGETYFVSGDSNSEFQIKNANGNHIDFTTPGDGVLAINEGKGLAAVVRYEGTDSAMQEKSQVTFLEKALRYDGYSHKVRVKSSHSSSKRYTTEYIVGQDGRIAVIDILVESPNNPLQPPDHKFRFTFTRDKMGRVEKRSAFNVISALEGGYLFSPVLESDYEYYYERENGELLLDAEGDPIALSGDFPESIEHRSGWDQGNATWSTILERVAYIRGEVGQPTRVSWSDGGFLNIGYTAAEGLKITSETYGVGAQAIDTGIYGYSANGSRITEVVNGVPFSYNYGAGFQLMNIQQGATPVSAFDYDLAGNLKTVSSTVTATYSLADELQSVTRNGITTTYSYDPEGRRIKAVSTTSGQQRKFVVAPTIGTDRDVLHMITDQNDVPKVMYFYAGDQPIMRFEVDAAGNPANPTFYLEDASGSILGLANATGELTTRFRYDGFGNPIGAQADPGNPNYFAASSGGDFRFHGTWLEGDSGLYKMGLRDYDPATGRFLQRDPANADLHDPESFHAYAFAEGNPWYYSDPTGAFSIIEVNAVSAKQISFATFKAGVVNSAKEYGKEQLFAALSEFTLNQLKAIYPPLDSIMNQFKADLSQGVGQYFEQQIMNKVCGGLQDNPVVQSIWFKPQLNNEGSPMGDGFNCRQLPSYKIEKGHFYPDFIISSYPPTDTQKGQDQKLAMLVGDIKLSGNSLYNQYVKPGERNKVGQFNAIASYASDSTYTKASVFIAAFTGQRWKLRQVGQLLGREGLKKGTLAFVIALAKNRNYNEKAPN